MKYIRTKYGVYKIIEEDLTMYYCNDNNRCLDKIHNLIIFDAHRKDEKDIRVANTIEELCDEAVAVYPDGSHDNCSVMHIVDNNGFCEAVYGCLSVSVDDLKKDYECWEIYGAIWTEWGLKYVAKMNNEGCLKLI